MRSILFWTCAAIGMFVSVSGEVVVVDSFGRNGIIKWTCKSLNVPGRIEWASTPAGPWHSSWEALRDMRITMPSNETNVPMFYRVVCEVPDPHFPDITPEQSLALLGIRKGEDSFVILDVRTPSEYTSRHVIDAVNINYYSPTFTSDLEALDKNKVYLIYCASGNRSGQAHDIMLNLGFHEVYNMLGGIGAFQGLEDAGAYLEP